MMKRKKELRQLFITGVLSLVFVFSTVSNLVLAASPTNTLHGKRAGTSLTSGVFNTFIGYESGTDTTTGKFNMFSGMYSGNKNITGSWNTFIGMRSGSSNLSGNNNTFLGMYSGLRNSTGGRNTFLGMNSGFRNTTGVNNTFMGYSSGVKNTKGNSNTCVGMYSGYNNTTGIGNVFIGYRAGFNETGMGKLYIANSSNAPPLIYGEFKTGRVGINTMTPGTELEINGTTRTKILEITGGSDLSEQFDISTPHMIKDYIKQGGFEIEPGMVACIDPDNPGKLLISNKAYDRTVAGIISGAGGVQTGMYMGQKGSIADGKYPVALTGRVYCKADAAYDAIQPGDLLTTSDTIGHVMKASDYDKARGAIIGKAMSPLDKGKGLVLVLVSLQ